MSKINLSLGGASYLLILQIILVVCKAAGWLPISWWLIFLPAYVSAVSILFVVCGVVIAWVVTK